MYIVKSPLPDQMVDVLEGFFCDSEHASQWTIEGLPGRGGLYLCGFFNNPVDAESAWKDLRICFPDLSDNPDVEPLEDRDWQEAYKEHFHPWSCKGMHWVPIWERDNYTVPNQDIALYLDPGMAFGTGNHPTTRLTLEGMMDFVSCVETNKLGGRRVVDAGCGSGILALSALLLGFRKVTAFDIDEDSLHVCRHNALLNGLQDGVDFFREELQTALKEGSADLILCNILANVLIENRKVLLGALNPVPDSCLVLSGILEGEADGVGDAYRKASDELGISLVISRITSEGWVAFSMRIPT